MRRRLEGALRTPLGRVAAALSVLASAVTLAGPPAEAPATPPPPALQHPEGVRDAAMVGWFTEPQAERGREAYMRSCAECHSPDLTARAIHTQLFRMPALVGEYFWDRWRGESVHTLQLVIQHTMPLDAPNSLDAETYAAITAHILHRNGFRPGARELPPAGDAPDVLVGAIIEPSLAMPLARPQAVGVPRPAEEEIDEDDTEAHEVDPGPETPPGAVEPAAPDAADAVDEPEDEGPVRAEWYAAQQAERARDAYRVHCARCHGGTLLGAGVTPSIAGENFLARWHGRSLADVLDVIVDAMPPEMPELVGPATAADLIALMLEHNGYPAGPVALSGDEDRLERFVLHRDGPDGTWAWDAEAGDADEGGDD